MKVEEKKKEEEGGEAGTDECLEMQYGEEEKWRREREWTRGDDKRGIRRIKKKRKEERRITQLWFLPTKKIY